LWREACLALINGDNDCHEWEIDQCFADSQAEHTPAECVGKADTVETDYCTGEPFCSNDIIESGEECDGEAGGCTGGLICSSECQCIPDYTQECQDWISACMDLMNGGNDCKQWEIESCYNDAVDAEGEECLNHADSVEEDYCTGEPFCGNDIVENGEECDGEGTCGVDEMCAEDCHSCQPRPPCDLWEQACLQLLNDPDCITGDYERCVYAARSAATQDECVGKAATVKADYCTVNYDCSACADFDGIYCVESFTGAGCYLVEDVDQLMLFIQVDENVECGFVINLDTLEPVHMVGCDFQNVSFGNGMVKVSTSSADHKLHANVLDMCFLVLSQAACTP